MSAIFPFARRLTLLITSFLSVTCSPAYLWLTVENIPSSAHSLTVIAESNGLQTRNAIEPIDVTAPPSSGTILLTLPSGFSSEVRLAVAAFAEPGAHGCLLATGQNWSQRLSSEQPTDSLAVQLTETFDGECTGKTPLLLKASPSLGLIDGRERVVLTGWGFAPGDVAYFAGRAAQTTYVSPTQLEVTTPTRVAIGPTEVMVGKNDGRSHKRSDLFRYFANTVDFGSVPFNPTASAKYVTDIVVGNFLPQNPEVSASAVTSLKSLDILNIMWMIPSQPIPTIDNNSVYSGAGTAPSGLATADMDGDGISDLVVALSGSNQVQVFLNDGSGGLMPQSPIGVQQQPEGVAASDLNGDGRPDIISANFGADTVSVILSKPGGGFLPMVPINTAAQPVKHQPISIAISDINLDGIKDIAVVNQGGGNVNVFMGLGMGGFTTNPIQFLVGTTPTQIAAADVNRDGIDDLLIVNKGSNNIQVLVNRSKNSSGAINFDTYTLETDTSPESMALADLNGDGVSDLVVPCSAANTVNVFVNKSPSGLKGTTAQKFAMPGAPVCTAVQLVAAIPFFNSGQLDLSLLCATGGAILKNQTL